MKLTALTAIELSFPETVEGLSKLRNECGWGAEKVGQWIEEAKLNERIIFRIYNNSNDSIFQGAGLGCSAILAEEYAKINYKSQEVFMLANSKDERAFGLYLRLGYIEILGMADLSWSPWVAMHKNLDSKN
ncbi:hypothetical protein HK100_005935, partial [Physocladia obscura]